MNQRLHALKVLVGDTGGAGQSQSTRKTLAVSRRCDNLARDGRLLGLAGVSAAGVSGRLQHDAVHGTGRDPEQRRIRPPLYVEPTRKPGRIEQQPGVQEPDSSLSRPLSAEDEDHPDGDR